MEGGDIVMMVGISVLGYTTTWKCLRQYLHTKNMGKCDEPAFEVLVLSVLVPQVVLVKGNCVFAM